MTPRGRVETEWTAGRDTTGKASHAESVVGGDSCRRFPAGIRQQESPPTTDIGNKRQRLSSCKFTPQKETATDVANIPPHRLSSSPGQLQSGDSRPHRGIGHSERSEESRWCAEACVTARRFFAALRMTVPGTLQFFWVQAPNALLAGSANQTLDSVFHCGFAAPGFFAAFAASFRPRRRTFSRPNGNCPENFRRWGCISPIFRENERFARRRR